MWCSKLTHSWNFHLEIVQGFLRLRNRSLFLLILNVHSKHHGIVAVNTNNDSDKTSLIVNLENKNKSRILVDLEGQTSKFPKIGYGQQ